MGNKLLRPSQSEPVAGFNDDQIAYLKEKFELLCDENNLLSLQRISQELQTTKEEASKILAYIDFDGHEEVDFYEFVCAAASLHQNDAQAREFIFEIYADGKEINENSFHILYGTIFRYLKFLNVQEDVYKPDVGAAKFKKYDYNGNGAISFEEFESMLLNDYHCRKWMQILGFAKEEQQESLQKPVNHQLPADFELSEQKGEQFGSTPAWYKVAEQMAPVDKGQKRQNKAPNVNLQIGYVYGYRSYDTRNNLRYNATGEVVYHTAACGIVLNKVKNTMKVNTTHNDDITCLDINTAKGLVVTGELGRKPTLVVWDANTLETKHVFAGKIQKSIGNVAISHSGRLVAATSQCDTHDIAIYDLATNSLVAAGNGPRSVVFAIKFNHKEDELICACDKEVVFVRFGANKMENKRGVFGKVPLNTSLSIALLGDQVVTSMSNGLLVTWRGNFSSKVYKQHSKSVGALSERADGGIISGDADGNIILWSRTMSKERQINLQKLLHPIKSNLIRIISLHQQANCILVGTRGGQIIEVSKGNTATVLMEGHYNKELWGLAVANGKNEFYTAGQDKLLLKWDMNKRKLMAKRKMENEVVTVDINRANMLAVGQKNGIVSLHDGNTLASLKKITAHKNPDKEVISVVKFSPDGNQLAIGYCPPISRVHLYDVNNLTKIGECKGSATRIFSIDFSMSGDALLCTSDEPLFYKSSNCSQITAVSSLKNEQWATMSSRLCWFSRGIWPPCSNGQDVNAVDRSNSRRYLATADDFSKLKVFRYPANIQRQMYLECKGHSSHVTGVKWSNDDRYCITIGGLEKSIIQWNVEEQQEVNYEVEEVKEEVEEQGEEEQYEFDDAPEAPKEGEFGMEVDQGDEALCVKPFLGQVKAMTPNGYRPTHKNQTPKEQLIVEHAWGVRNLYIKDRVRNQVRYSSNGSSCLFITAALGVEMDLQSKKQSFYQGQSDDLVSFAITKDRRYCATGQMAQLNLKNPKDKIVDVHVWDAVSKKQIVKLTKFHQRAIVVVQFSPSGKRLLTVGQDDKNSLAVYDWEINRIAWSSPVDGAKVSAAAWKSEIQYVTVGLKHIKFWNEGKGSMGKIPGKWDPMLSTVYWNDKYVSGGASGSIYLWNGNNGVATKGHQGTLDCLAVDLNKNLLSGCSKGIIIMWKAAGGKLSMERKICDTSKFDIVDGGVLSMDFYKDNMLLCTNSSSIYMLALKEKNDSITTIMESHYKGELWAQCWAPDGVRFVSGGDDKTVRVYDTNSKKQLHIFKTKEQIRGLDWEQSQGKLIVVGDYKGKIYLFDQQLNLLDEKRTKFSKTKPRQEPFWIADIKFSPNGQYVAFGAHGGPSHVEIYEVAGNKFADNGKVLNGLFTSALLSIDWNQGSDLIAAVSQAYQLQFMNLSGRVSASSVKDVKWASWSSKFGFCVSQIHQDSDYSHLNAVCQNATRSLIATGSDDQKVRLFNYPVTIPKQKCKAFTGHSSHVTRVRFNKTQQHLLSLGGNDRTVILWRVEGAEEMQEEVEEENEAQEEEYEGDDVDEVEVPRSREEKLTEKAETKVNSDDFELDDDEGDQFMAVKPWLGAIKEPTKPYFKSQGKPPKATLELEYAHGYRTKDCRNNLRYINEDKIVYHTAGLGVIMDINKSPHEQTFFSEHTDDIISMAWSIDGQEIFTGQMGAKPVIYRWTTDGSPKKAYKGAKKGVSALATNEIYLVAAGLDDDHYLYLFDVDKGMLLASEKGGRDVIIAMKWIREDSFVSVGLKHYRLWEMNGKTIKGKTGVFGKNCNLLCCVEVAADGAIYTGAANGQVQLWAGNSCSKSMKIHKGAINAMRVHGELLLTGSNDQSVSIIQSNTLTVINRIDCGKLLSSSICCSIRAVDAKDNRILIGTLGSEIFELKSNQKIENATNDGQFKLIANYMNGHYAPNFVTNQVWGLSIVDESTFASCSDDGTLRVWDVNKKEQIACVNLKFNNKLQLMVLNPKDKQLPDSVKGRCLTVSSEGDFVIGCKDGTVRVIDNKMSPNNCRSISKKQLSHAKFSPDGTVLAIGSHDGRIYLFNWSEEKNLKLMSQSIKHNSYIKHFDFSRDGNYLHSTCGAYQLLFWNTQTGKQVTSGATMTRDQQWATWNVTLGWPVQGIWQPFMDGTDVNAVDRSHSSYQQGMRLLASGDDMSHVRLLQYPCVVKNSQSVMGRGHSSHVTNVLFTPNDKYLLSSGGEDQTLLQWRVEAE